MKKSQPITDLDTALDTLGNHRGIGESLHTEELSEIADDIENAGRAEDLEAFDDCLADAEKKLAAALTAIVNLRKRIAKT